VLNHFSHLSKERQSFSRNAHVTLIGESVVQFGVAAYTNPIRPATEKASNIVNATRNNFRILSIIEPIPAPVSSER
jgi:hypothetical protein